MTVEIGDQLQEYEVVDYIGAGHFGQVFKARHHLLDEVRALKFLPVNSSEEEVAALTEIEAIRGFNHPSIMEISDARVFEVRNERFVAIAMPVALSGSLEAIGRSGELTFSSFLRFMSQSLAGLNEVHRLGSIHRDIKPGNILVSQNAAKLSDFGLSIKLNQCDALQTQGYITHLAPEVIEGAPQDSLSDIYAAGVTAFRLVNGYFDFGAVLRSSGITKSNELKKISNKVGFRPWVPNRLQRVIRKAMHPDPGRRFQTADDFQRRLEALRVNIDWKISYGEEWTGFDGNRNYAIQLDRRRKVSVVCTKNGRRWADFCAKYDEESDALAHLWECVATTSLFER
ncbi:putative Serine/threonine protein kinase [Oceanicaulis sp. 350]|nr:putative Serine/threonine protein kinase [Oceanicaulis sp. 350]